MQTTPSAIPFIDVQAQKQRINNRLQAAIAKVLEGGAFILGPEVKEFEKQLASFAGVTHAISCANGTDALMLPLMAWGIGAGDAVFVPTFTFVATAEVVVLLGATPVFVDVNPGTFNMDPDSLRAAIAHARTQGLKPKVVIPVDLFGLPADYAAITPIAAEGGLKMLCDTAQGFGASVNGRRTGTFGHATSTSFFPSKPLGCYGDGGAILTNDAELAAALDSIRVHGKGKDKYDTVRIGVNSRLDTLQAAILSVKLEIFADEIVARQRVAQAYNEGLAGCGAQTPEVPKGMQSVWAQYTLKLNDRERVAAELKARGIPTMVYYPKPLHKLGPYSRYPTAPGGLANAEMLADKVLSLPMHPYLEPGVQSRIIAALHEVTSGTVAQKKAAI